MHPREVDRRALLRAGLAASLAASIGSNSARADAEYPNRPIRLLIGTPAGDSADASTREIAGKLAALLGQAIYVDNKPGAHGMIVGSAMKAAARDGYTLLVSTGGPIAINPSLYGSRLPYDPMKDFAPVVAITKGSLYLAAASGISVTSVSEMIAYVKSHPGKVSYGSGGTGSTQHLAMELLKKAAGLQMTHVPYRGSPMVIQDLIGGRIEFAFDAGASMLPQAKGGKVRLIGVTSRERSPATPEVPTLIEQGIVGFEANVWSGLFARAGTPDAVVERLNRACNEVLRTPEFGAFARANASEPGGGSSKDFREFIASETARWAVAVRESGAQPE